MGHMPKIGGLQNAAYFINKDTAEPGYVASAFVPKVKLHGTNAGIRIDSEGNVTAQSKSRDIRVGDDNFGFAAFVDSLDTDKLGRFAYEAFGDLDGWTSVTLMGEWAGPGIQKGVAISGIPEKTFFVFAIFWEWPGLGEIIREVHYDSWPFWDMESSCKELSEQIVFLAPHTSKIEADFRVDGDKKIFTDDCNNLVAEIEAQCPIAKEYGVEGIGEGAVYYPYSSRGWVRREEFDNYAFKVKGDKHAVNKAGRPARLKSDIPESAHKFVEFYVTKARLEQGLQEIGGELTNKNIGPMIKWVANDILAECQQEIADAELDWKKDLSGLIARRTKSWFIEKQREV